MVDAELDGADGEGAIDVAAVGDVAVGRVEELVRVLDAWREGDLV